MLKKEVIFPVSFKKVKKLLTCLNFAYIWNNFPPANPRAATAPILLIITEVTLGCCFIKSANPFNIGVIASKKPFANGANEAPTSAKPNIKLFFAIFNWLEIVFILSLYSAVTLSFSPTACLASFNFCFNPSRLLVKTAIPFWVDALFPKISPINPALSAWFAFLIFSSTFKIVPSASLAISLSKLFGFIPKNCKAFAFALVLAPWANSEYNLLNTVLVCSELFRVDCNAVANPKFASFANPIFLAYPAVLNEISAKSAAWTGYLFDNIFIVSM